MRNSIFQTSHPGLKYFKFIKRSISIQNSISETDHPELWVTDSPAQIALQTAEKLAEKGVSAEVIDIRSLIPLDTETIVESIKKTNYAAVLSQAPGTGCYGEHIAFEIQQKAFDYMDAPVELIAAYECPPPMAPTLEEEFMPNAEKATARILAMLGK